MNRLEFADLRHSALHYYRFSIRVLDRKRRATTFSRGGEPDALQRIYVKGWWQRRPASYAEVAYKGGSGFRQRSPGSGSPRRIASSVR